jgi:hypothetical protein
MKKEDLINFNYEIVDDIVCINTNVQDLKINIAENTSPVELVAYSWSVPVSEIEGMEDPTDYLKDAIVKANS